MGVRSSSLFDAFVFDAHVFVPFSICEFEMDRICIYIYIYIETMICICIRNA